MIYTEKKIFVIFKNSTTLDTKFKPYIQLLDDKKIEYQIIECKQCPDEIWFNAKRIKSIKDMRNVLDGNNNKNSNRLNELLW